MQPVALLNLELFPIGLWVALAIVSLVILVIIIGKTQVRKTNRRLSETYRLVYRIVSVPSDNQVILKAESASIEVGDYGWEAEPIYQDGLIYLHGLNPRWQVVWYAGFRPDQVEVVESKPKSQYNIFPYWVDAQKVPRCPFAVQKYKYRPFPVKKDQYRSFDFGFPVEIHRMKRGQNDWVQGKLVSKQK